MPSVRHEILTFREWFTDTENISSQEPQSQRCSTENVPTCRRGQLTCPGPAAAPACPQQSTLGHLDQGPASRGGEGERISTGKHPHPIHTPGDNSIHTYSLQQQEVEDGSIQVVAEQLNQDCKLDTGFVFFQEDERVPSQHQFDAQRTGSPAGGALWELGRHGGGCWHPTQAGDWQSLGRFSQPYSSKGLP